jgi:hypothetical protein
MGLFKIVVLVMLTAAVQQAHAQQQNNGSSGHMLPLCKAWLTIADKDVEAIKNMLRNDPNRLTTAGMCAGVVIGIEEALRTFQLSCPSDGVTNEQLVRMVVSEIENHPERLHEDFVVPASTVMIARWPCHK